MLWLSSRKIGTSDLENVRKTEKLPSSAQVVHNWIAGDFTLLIGREQLWNVRKWKTLVQACCLSSLNMQICNGLVVFSVLAKAPFYNSLILSLPLDCLTFIGVRWLWLTLHVTHLKPSLATGIEVTRFHSLWATSKHSMESRPLSPLKSRPPMT